MAQTLQIIADVKAQAAKTTLSDLDRMIDKLRLKRIDVNYDKFDNATKNVKQFADELGNVYTVTEKLNKSGGIASSTVKVTEYFDKQAKSARTSAKAVDEATKATESHSTKTRRAKIDVDEFGDSFEGTAQKASALSTALGRLGQVVVASLTRAFKDALDEMKKVDSELVVVRKVTNASTEELESLRDTAYSTAKQYGLSASDYLSSVAEFSRAGYKEQSADLAELATRLQLVGDVSQDVANKFLIATDKSYKFEGNVDKLSLTIDKANEIDNNYATTIEKLASGMGIIAPVAAQLNVSLDETMAAVGTITAVTQRSGTEAARALRAIMLNIVGDTKTEIEDGATWTAGEIVGLRDLLREYAPQIVEEAQKMGTVINPMEAIGALSKAYKDGVLTAQELTERVSDIGGKLRTPQLLALIQNWDEMYLEMMDDISTATGSAQKEVDNALTGWDAKLKVLKTSWTDFIQKDINTDTIKGAISALTWLVDSFGSLGTAIATVVPLIIALKAQDIISWATKSIGSITKLASSFVTFGQNLISSEKSLESYTAKAQVGLTALSLIIMAVAFAINNYKKSIDDAIQQGEKAQIAVASINELSDKYSSLEERMKAGENVSSQFADSRDKLIEKLKDEGVWVDSVIGKYQTLEEKISAATEEALKNRRVQINDALDAAQSNLNWTYRMSFTSGWIHNAGNILGMGTNYANPNGKYNIWELDAERTLELYDAAVKKRAEFAQGIGGAPGSKEDNDLKTFINTYQDAVEKYRAAKKSFDDINESSPTSVVDANQELLLSFVGLSDEINNATKALEAYKKALEGGEKGDTFKSYAEAYKSAMDMFEKGLTGTNQYIAAVDLLIPKEVLAALQYDYEEAGKLLGSDFYKALFEYDGTDFGANAAQFFKDNAQAFGKYYEVIEDESGNFNIAINDITGLSKALNISEDALWSLLDAWDAFSSDTAVSIADLKLLKEQFTDVNSGVFDFTSLISSLVSQGKTDSEIRRIVQGLLQMQDLQDLDLSTLPENLTQAIQDIRELQDSAEGLGEGFEVKVVTNPSNVTSVLDPLVKQIDTISNTPVKVGVVYTGTIPDFIGPRLPHFARGIDKASAGLAVVNEEGAEIIARDKRAFIANEGRLGLVNLQQGDTVYTASETRSLLNTLAPSTPIPLPEGNSNDSKTTNGTVSGFSSAAIAAILSNAKKEDENSKDKSKTNKKGKEESVSDSDLQSMLNDYISDLLDKAKKALDAQIETIDAQIEKLRAEHDAQEEANELEELRLKILEAEKALVDANVERTVRYFNKATGQWEWMADQKAVAEAQKSLEDAQQAYYDKLADIEYQAKLDELQAQKDALNENYNTLSDTWNELKDEISKALSDKNVLGLAEILTKLGLTAASGSVGGVNSLISNIEEFTGSFDNGGFALGKGFLRKATAKAETVLDESLTDMILSPRANSQFANFTNSLSKLFGISTGDMGAKAQSLINTLDRSSSIVGDTYYINGVRIGSDMLDRPLSEVLSVLPIYAS